MINNNAPVIKVFLLYYTCYYLSLQDRNECSFDVLVSCKDPKIVANSLLVHITNFLRECPCETWPNSDSTSPRGYDQSNLFEI